VSDQIANQPTVEMAGTAIAPPVLPTFELAEFVKRVLAEDMGSGGDVTSRATIDASARFVATMNCREPIVVAGLDLAVDFFRALDREVVVERGVRDGEDVAAGTVLLRIAGHARAMLAAERSALNTLQHLSGVATLTRRFVEAIAGTGAILLDTRKTIPGLRLLEKYAARMGGAENHRMRMDDGLLIKDNHVAVCGGVAAAVRAAKEAKTGLPIQVEVDRIDQIEPALAAGADRLLLDNMSPDLLRDAVTLVAGRVPTEASGGVRLDTIRAIAMSGVTYVSVGRITQSAPAVDIGLDYELQ
jgi:nicotinate-nucleotide pyrophosphorylase (carboxylating)